MRRWVALFVVGIAVVLAALSATNLYANAAHAIEMRLEHESEAEMAAEGDYAGGESPEREALEELFAATASPGTFSGDFAPPGTCGANTFLVEAGTVTIDVTVTATLPTNDITLALVDPSGATVATQDSGTSPEAIHYSRTSLPTGTWTIKTCPAGNGALFLPPYSYTGVYALTSAPVGDSPGVPGAQAGSAGTMTPTFADGNLKFSPETIVDPQRTEGEPVNFIAPDGTYWESGPFGTSTQQSWVHKSTDGGLEFHAVSATELRPDAPPGGGDTDIVVDDQGYAYFSDLEGLTNVGTSVSNDGGHTWRKNVLAAQEVGVDRQWYAMDNGATASASDNTIFFTYRQIPAGPQILSSPGSTGANDQVGGLVWTNAASGSGTLTVSSGSPCGQMKFDEVRRNLYMPCGNSDHVQVVIGHVAPGQRTGIAFHTVELPTAPPKGDPSIVFPWLDTDAAGNLMVVWIDGTDRNVYISVSKDEGATWTTPLKVNRPPATSNVFPQVAGGAAGTFAVTWYGSESTLSSDDMPANTSADSAKFPWYGYVAEITKADTLSPKVAQQRFTSHPMHYGLVCNGGTTCTSGRTMADYFDVNYDKSGAIRIVFDDESSQYRQAHLMEVRQLLTGTQPKSPMADESGDAQMPHYQATGSPGANRPQADFTKLALSQPASGVLRVQMSLADLASLTPPAGKTQLVWLTRFQAKSVMKNGAEAYRIFYVGAKAVNGAKPTYFAGSGDDPTGCFSTSGGCKILVHLAEVPLTSGSVSGNTITIDVSLQNGFGSGRPINGNTLYAVTALSYGQNADQDIYMEGDATHSFDFALGAVPPSAPQPTASSPVAKGPSGGSQPVDNGPSGSAPASKGTLGVVIAARHSAVGKGSFKKARFSFTVNSRRASIAWAQRGFTFRLLRVTSARFNKNAARFTGFARVNGKRVRFALVAVDRGKRGDIVRVAWNGGPSRGGVVRKGTVVVK